MPGGGFPVSFLGRGESSSPCSAPSVPQRLLSPPVGPLTTSCVPASSKPGVTNPPPEGAGSRVWLCLRECVWNFSRACSRNIVHQETADGASPVSRPVRFLTGFSLAVCQRRRQMPARCCTDSPSEVWHPGLPLTGQQSVFFSPFNLVSFSVL